MDALSRFVTGALRRTYDQEVTDVNETVLEATADGHTFLDNLLIQIGSFLSKGFSPPPRSIG